MRSANWHTSPISYDTVRRLSQALETSEITASILARRGYGDPDKARLFLDSQGALHDPFLFPQMQAVCDRLRLAISRGERICVHGDYDVDGITSTALLVNVLQSMGANVAFHLPNRFTEGYGIALPTVEKIAGEGTTLLIAVDCGIGAREQLSRAGELGMESIVIDHHRPLEENLPSALIISPLICDYPFKELAGVGLAFKVAQALVAESEPASDFSFISPEIRHHLDLVALGTIADVVPLVDENRTLVKLGLIQLARTEKPGLKELMRIGQIDQSRVNTGLVAFRMAPRINAAGRLEDPTPALELMLTEDLQRAEELAGQLDASNRERQRIENQMLAEARKMISEWPEEQQLHHGYVLSSPGWHEGVIGIVASRLVETYHRPVIMIAENESQGLGKGSGRSVPGFDLHGALVELGDLLKAFGGHRAACGLTVDINSVEEFRKQFADYADLRLTDDELMPSRYVDALVCGRELTLELAQELARLEPFGLGNPAVELLLPGAHIMNGRVTRDGQHLQCQVEAGGARSKAIGFGQAYLQEKLKNVPDWDVACLLERNEFNGSVSPQLQLREIFPRESQTAIASGMCESHCDSDCPDRVTGDEFWGLLSGNLEITDAWLPSAATARGARSASATDLSKRLIDRRNFGGINAQITRLIAGGESVLVLTADVARRRRLLSDDLKLSQTPGHQVLLASSRCGRLILEKRLSRVRQDGPGLMLADFATVTALPGLAENFDHLVFVDPPLNAEALDFLVSTAPDAFVHLFYCSDEVQFTHKVLEHEYDLRSPLTRVYRHLEAGKTYPLNETTERLLLAGGKHLRQPLLVARCLKILEELSLISFMNGKEGPMLTLLEAERTELDRSATYAAIQCFYKECLQFLSKSLNAKVI
ncbi:MAG: single-stranded-DNA-specific exonuclease RecJ [Thermoleophilia bacterium]